jgi:hypothetical protein
MFDHNNVSKLRVNKKQIKDIEVGLDQGPMKLMPLL